MGKGRTGKRRGGNNTPPSPPPDELSLDALWEQRRQGARNLAGTTYQTQIAALLLVRSATGRLPYTKIVPEGLEDIDCHVGNDRRVLVQAKEVTGSNFTVGALADALAHAAPALRASDSVVVVTNASLESRLRDDWHVPLGKSLSSPGRKALSDALEAEGVDPEFILARSSVARLTDADFVEIRHLLANRFKALPEVGALMHARLLAELATHGGEQRGRSRRDAIEWSISALEELASTVQATVNPDALEAAVNQGIVEHVGFQSKSDLSLEQFLAGVDATPAHVASGFDVPRPDMLEAIIASLEQARSVVLVGSSGAGKSALLWRAAREMTATARVVRVRRVASDIEAESLLRYIRLLVPDPSMPILVCCDDLGRRHTSGWPSAVRALDEMPGIMVLAAARVEDFSPSLVSTRTRIVRPTLERDTAQRIHETLRARGVHIGLAFEEAWRNAKGLMMEFVALATGGARLERVVEAQARTVTGPGREVEFDALRLICVAHLAGAPVSSSFLGGRLGGGGSCRVALDRLRDEHIIVEDLEGNWSGLHELRSEVIVRVLHASPPPTLGHSVAELIQYGAAQLAAATLTWFARREGRLSHVVMEALDARVRRAQGDELVALLSAALVVDAHVTASGYKSLAERVVLQLPLYSRVLLAMSWRRGTPFADKMDPAIFKLGDQLPTPETNTRAAALAALATRRLAELPGPNPDSVPRLFSVFEALDPGAGLPADQVFELLSKNVPPTPTWAGACARALERETLVTRFGSLEDRLRELARQTPRCIEFAVEEAEDGVVMRLRVVMPPDGEVHAQALALAHAIRERCPDASFAEIVTVQPGGSPVVMDGHKRIPISALSIAPAARMNSAILDEVEGLTRATYWTEWLRALASLTHEAVRILDGAITRLLDLQDRPRRRREWLEAVVRFGRGTAALKAPPGADFGPAVKTPAAVVFSIGTALEQLALGHLFGSDPTAVGRVAMQLLDVRDKLEQAIQSGIPTFVDERPPFPDSLLDRIELVASLLMTLDLGVDRSEFQCGAGESWTDTARRVTTRIESEALAEEQAALATAISGLEATVVRVSRRAWLPWSLSKHAWVICTSALDDIFLDRIREVVAARTSLPGRVQFLVRIGDLGLPISGTFWKERWIGLDHNSQRALAQELLLRWPDGPRWTAFSALLRDVMVVSSELWLGHRRAEVFDETLDVARALAPPRDALRGAEAVLEPNLLEGASVLLEFLELEAGSPDAVPLVHAIDTNQEIASAVLRLSLAMIEADEAALASRE
jgi:hypothetical protein